MEPMQDRQARKKNPNSQGHSENEQSAAPEPFSAEALSMLSTAQAAATLAHRELISEVQVHDETGRLKKVILGRADTFGTAQAFSANCRTTERAIQEGKIAPVDQLGASELTEIRRCLGEELGDLETLLVGLGVEVLRPQPLQTQEQMFPRDPLIVIGDKVLVSRMKHPSRWTEIEGIEPLFDPRKSGLVVSAPGDVFIEGGDVMVRRDTIFVGIGGPRTSANAVQFLSHTFPTMKVVPFALAPADSDQNVLHLDCCLNFVGARYVLLYKGGFREPVDVLKTLASYDLDIIEVSEREQGNFATNILSISPTIVVSRPSTPELNEGLRQRGYDVREIEFGTVELFGGSFRCATHPLWRESGNDYTLN